MGGARTHKIRPPITLNPEGCLSYHLELSRWSLGLMGGGAADLKPELSYITLNSEHRLRAWE